MNILMVRQKWGPFNTKIEISGGVLMADKD